MTKFRIETVKDPISGLFYAEAFFPEDATEPFATTRPIYKSHHDAEQDVMEMFRKNFPEKPVSATR